MSEVSEDDRVILRALELDKAFGLSEEPIQVLSKASLEVQTGELLGIVGASGAGKSTLLHILGGLDKPSRGKVLFRKLDIFRQSRGYLESFRNMRVGFVFQFFNLLNEFSVLENAMFPALIAGENSLEAKEGAENLLEQVGLKDRINHRPSELSGGESQRVALARGLINNPEVVLADEPTGNLDSRSSERLLELFRNLNQEFGQTFVVVTHSQRLAQSMDRVLQLSEGEVHPIEKELIL